MVENNVEDEWKNRALNKRHNKHNNVFMRYLIIPPLKIKYLIINIILITLMTQLTIVKSSLLTHKGFTFNGETPRMTLIQRKHFNGQCPSFSNVFASPLTTSDVLRLSYIA